MGRSNPHHPPNPCPKEQMVVDPTQVVENDPPENRAARAGWIGLRITAPSVARSLRYRLLKLYR